MSRKTTIAELIDLGYSEFTTVYLSPPSTPDVERLTWALRNIRLIAARGRVFGHQATPQTHEKMAAKKDAALDRILGLCAEVGVVGSILRGVGDTPTPGGA